MVSNQKRVYNQEWVLMARVWYIYICMGQILLIQKLPGELEMAFTTAISSLTIFVEGKKRHPTNPSVKISKKSRPHK